MSCRRSCLTPNRGWKRAEVNTEYAKSWPNITQKKEAPTDAKEFEGVEGKFEKYFSKEPGAGD